MKPYRNFVSVIYELMPTFHCIFYHTWFYYFPGSEPFLIKTHFTGSLVPLTINRIQSAKTNTAVWDRTL